MFTKNIHLRPCNTHPISNFILQHVFVINSAPFNFIFIRNYYFILTFFFPQMRLFHIIQYDLRDIEKRYTFPSLYRGSTQKTNISWKSSSKKKSAVILRGIQFHTIPLLPSYTKEFQHELTVYLPHLNDDIYALIMGYFCETLSFFIFGISYDRVEATE